jgi:Domain of unknown function (DUF4396)
MAVMDAGWPLTMLYRGPLGLPFYFSFGRAPPPGRRRGRKERPMPEAAFLDATHCGAGFALGDFIVNWLAFATGFTLVGSAFAGKLVLGFALALSHRDRVPVFAVAPMRGPFPEGRPRRRGQDRHALPRRLRSRHVRRHGGRRPPARPRAVSLAYWLTMQAAMHCGFATTYPVNWALIRAGVKEAM